MRETEASNGPETTMNRGKLLILLIVGAGIAAGTLKVWKQHRHMDQVLTKLSPAVVRLIAEAPQVELLRLRLAPDSANSAESDNLFRIDGRTYEVLERKILVGTKGIADVRDRLVDDASYKWDAPIDQEPRDWQYAMRFMDGAESASLGFSFVGDRLAVVKLLDDGPTLTTDLIADGLQTYFAAQFEEPAAAAETRN